FLFLFHNLNSGDYVLLSYNIIEQKVATPILCNGYSIFENGKLLYFRSESEASKNHLIQIWQTPYISLNYEIPSDKTDSFLYKIGNKPLVRAMAECYEVMTLVQKDEAYEQIYIDILRKTEKLRDAYHFLDAEDCFNLDEILKQIQITASEAIDEFDKVLRIKENTKTQFQNISGKAQKALNFAKRGRYETTDDFVKQLTELRGLRGEIIGLKKLPYIDVETLEEFEEQLKKESESLSQKCVNFLLAPNSLDAYQERQTEYDSQVTKIERVSEADALLEKVNTLAQDLQILIDTVSNLRIDDATEATAIVERISDVFSKLNRTRSQLRNRRNALREAESRGEFAAQFRLLDQAVINYIDLCDTPEATESYLTKLMVQVEEIEGRFGEFDEYIAQLSEKRDEIYQAFESRKLQLVERRNQRALALQNAAQRILKGVAGRLKKLETVAQINGYFASDLMIDKTRDLVRQLREIGDSVKADEIETRLKTAQESAVRQLKDKQELFQEGDDIIRFGQHLFSVNNQNLELTMILREGSLFYHLTGTNFFEKVAEEDLMATKEVWEQDFVSENKQVYRAEYLAFSIFEAWQSATNRSLEDVALKSDAELLLEIQKFMSNRYDEGYTKGVHDHDALLILRALLNLHRKIGLLRYSTEARACAQTFWDAFIEKNTKENLHNRLKGVHFILQAFPNARNFEHLMADIAEHIGGFCQKTQLFEHKWVKEAAEYLFYAISQEQAFTVSPEAVNLKNAFIAHLQDKGFEKTYKESLQKLDTQPESRFQLIQNWLESFVN
ncbi:MAG: DNA repair ATPase, partial [Bernardetiaceae bacterium]|nr:DNA repair ATPase [Bernardetiaceae bacterium]